ncbi:MAG TPA: helix-turn-helix transcriptional regulator [Bacteroidota bacterium]|jgi:transcriptional regulator with XRE-family HTH domain|nr:helix-turn-helix transcriptional regulator [Bacteroidota bacterium]
MGDLKEINDEGLLRLLGNRAQQERLNQNMTQADLSQKAGVTRIVLTRLESGRGCTLTSLIRILRALGKLDQLDLFLPEPGISPLQLAELGGRERTEATGKRGRPGRRR